MHPVQALALEQHSRSSCPFARSAAARNWRSDAGLRQGVELAGLHLLVVDDQADARELMRVLLQSQELKSRPVDSAGAALHVLSRQQVDVLVADIGMPEQDGYSLIQAVRALHSLAHVRLQPSPSLPMRAPVNRPGLSMPVMAGTWRSRWIRIS